MLSNGAKSGGRSSQLLRKSTHLKPRKKLRRVRKILRRVRRNLRGATLQEYGHNMVVGGRLFNWRKRGKGKHVGFVEGKPFVRPAWDESEAAAIAAIEESITADILKEVEKLGG
jgi:hypothetical protein